MIAKNISAGDAFAFPIGDGRIGVCRILQRWDDGHLVVACSAWIGDPSSVPHEQNLRPILQMTHHSWDCALIQAVKEPLPAQFVYLGVIVPTDEEQSLKCRMFGSWEGIREQPLMQWEWDTNKQKILDEEKADRTRVGQIVFGDHRLDQLGTIPWSSRHSVQTFVRRAALCLWASAGIFQISSAQYAIALACLIACGAVAFELGWIFVERSRREARFFRRVERTGIDFAARYRGPAWLTRRVGRELRCFYRVTFAVLGDKVVTVRLLQEIGTLTDLECLNIIGCEIEECGLKYLKHLHKLTMLFLHENLITDAGVKDLWRLKSLQFLTLDHTQVTDAAAPRLAKIRRLRSINLGHTGISDVTLNQFKGRVKLQTLNLSSTRITDAGLGSITDMRIEYLDLDTTDVTDAGLKMLESMPLLGLWLGGTRITDDGLSSLSKIITLKSLSIGGTGVSDAGLCRLEPLVSLEFIHLGLTAVTVEGLAHLERLPNLARIHLEGPHFSQKTRERLRRRYPQWEIFPEP